MRKKWRLIIDSKHDGYYNMAADEAVFIHYNGAKLPTLRIYGWSQPFISLGYNQKARNVLTFKKSIPFVRRVTGGGSIFHYEELTYSISCALSDLDLSAKVKKSYEELCAFLIRFYSMLGIEVKFAKDIFLYGLGQFSDFCFSSCEHFDLVARGKKIGGNAQRRKKSIIFQQGSIPQSIDSGNIKISINNTEAIEEKTTCLNELLNQKTNFNHLQCLLAAAFKEVFDIEFIEKDFFPQEKEIIGYLIAEKYKQEKWNFKN